MDEQQWEPRSEDMRVKGEQLVQRVKELVHEGNVRSLTIKDRDGKTIFHIPLTAGLIGIALAPTLAAVGAVAAVLTECTITVERRLDKAA